VVVAVKGGPRVTNMLPAVITAGMEQHLIGEANLATIQLCLALKLEELDLIVCEDTAASVHAITRSAITQSGAVSRFDKL
jgi:hypothetical protein